MGLGEIKKGEQDEKLTVAAEIYLARCEQRQMEELLDGRLDQLQREVSMHTTLLSLTILACTWYVLRAIEG